MCRTRFHFPDGRIEESVFPEGKTKLLSIEILAANGPSCRKEKVVEGFIWDKLYRHDLWTNMHFDATLRNAEDRDILFKLAIKLDYFVLSNVIVFLFGIVSTEIISNKNNLPNVFLIYAKYYSPAFGNTSRLFSGPFFIWVGMLFADREPKKTTGLVMTLMGAVIIVLDAFPYAETIGKTLLSIGIIAFSLHIEIDPKPIHKRMRIASKVLYYSHMYVWTIFYTIVYGEATRGIIPALATALIATGISVALIVAKEKGSSINKALAVLGL